MIDKVQIYGERHSGTTWLTELVLNNFKVKDTVNHVGHKHWFPNISKIDGVDLETILFIVITRDPYNWCEAMHRMPHHAHPDLQKLPKEEFIKHQWHCVMNYVEKYKPVNKEMFIDRDPNTLRRFDNILELRTAKHLRFLSVQNIAPYFIQIRYEDLANDFRAILNQIVEDFPITAKYGTMQGSSHGSGKRPLSKRSIKFINENLDWEVEKRVGYERNRTH